MDAVSSDVTSAYVVAVFTLGSSVTIDCLVTLISSVTIDCLVTVVTLVTKATDTRTVSSATIYCYCC